jgi:hypothetical protein
MEVVSWGVGIGVIPSWKMLQNIQRRLDAHGEQSEVEGWGFA